MQLKEIGKGQNRKWSIMRMKRLKINLIKRNQNWLIGREGLLLKEMKLIYRNRRFKSLAKKFKLM